MSRVFFKIFLYFLNIFLDAVKDFLYNDNEVITMDFSKKIRMGEAVAKMSEAELARKIGTTPQAFNQRVKTGKFKYEELESIASALGAELVLKLRFSDGTEV